MSSVIQVNRIYLIFNHVHFLVDSSVVSHKIKTIACRQWFILSPCLDQFCVDEHLSPMNKKEIAVKELNNIRKNAVNIWRIRRKTLNLRYEKDAKT